MSTTQPEVIDTTLEAKQRNLEELLQESEERFRLIADATPVMISLIDSQHNPVYCNTVQREFIGHSVEQQLDKAWFQNIHPEDKQQYQKKYDTAFAAQEKFQIEYRRRRADGEYRWVLETGVPRFTRSNKFVGYVCSCVDVTGDNLRAWCKEQSQRRILSNSARKNQLLPKNAKNRALSSACVEIRERKRTEEALKASEARLRLALNAAQMGVWDWDIEKESVTYSKREEAIFGFAPGDFDRTYQAFFNRIHPEDRKRVNQANQNTIKNGDEYDIDYRIIWQDNTIHWIREKGAVLRNETGKAVRMLGITMDITESKQAEKSLQQIKRALPINLLNKKNCFIEYLIKSATLST